MGYVYLFLTIVFSAYCQLVLKWRLSPDVGMPDETWKKILLLFSQIGNPWVFSVFVSAVCATLAWIATLTRLEISHAFPFRNLVLVIVLLCSVVFLGESLTWNKSVGTLVIIVGAVILAS